MMFFLLSLVGNHALALSCKTTFDELNIPHVETSSLEETYYCFGMFHGQDRAWQMDYFRRVAQGRNAEVLGVEHLKSDLMMRLLDLPKLADKIWNGFPSQEKKLLEIYAQGVNEGFKTGKNAKELIDLNYEPEKWLPIHSIQVLLIQSFDQTRKTFFRDYEDELSKEKWGEKAEDLFNEDKIPWLNTILKEGEYEKADQRMKTSSFKHKPGKIWAEFPTLFGLESGSNNWAISKKQSKSGKAIFANDPHLDLKTPIFWYWISLKNPKFKVLGGSVPGVPIVVSGTNGKVAWGLTNSYFNSADAVFVEDLKDEQIESFRPIVWFKWWKFKIPFFFKSFEILKSGQKVLPLELESNQRMVLRWSGFSLESKDIVPMFSLADVKTVEDLDQKLIKVGLPSWNYVFADSKGDIGYRLIGKVYKESHKKVYGIPMISFKEFSQEQFLSGDERPHILKPKRQHIYSANNRHWPSDAKFDGGRGYTLSFRGHRIDSLLPDAKDIEDVKKIQCDRMAVDAQFFVPKLQKYLEIEEFKNWDFMTGEASLASSLYRRIMDLVMEKWKVNEIALYRILENPESNQINELKEIKLQALKDVAKRPWGEIHRLKFPHLSKNKDWVFAPNISGPGDTHSVDPGTAKWNKDLKIYEQFSGSSMRMIIELEEPPRIWLSLPGVNRNHDKTAIDQTWANWKDCQYQEVKF